MALIHSQNTKPEKVVRSMLHRMGFRFRLYRRDFPGHPDIILPKYRSVVFVHGCFWHYHQNCQDGKIPKSNQEYWKPKLEKTVRRDREALEVLQSAGWKTLVIWECEVTKDLAGLRNKLISFLNNDERLT